MAGYTGMVLTTKGRNLQAKAQIGTELVFTKVKIGNGTLPVGTQLDNLTDLISSKLSLAIQDLAVLSDGTSRIRVIVSNENLLNGFAVTEIGVFAQDPTAGEILYSIVNAGDQADYLPASGGSVVVEQTLDLITVIGNAQNVTAVINDRITIATKEDVDSKIAVHNSNEQSHPNYKRGWAMGRNYVLQGIPNGSGVQEAIRKLNDTTLEMPAGILLNFAAGMSDYGPVDIVEKLENAKTLAPTPADAFTIPLAYTEDLCEGGTAISGGDSGIAGRDKNSAFDNNLSTFWNSMQSGTAVNGAAYIGYDFGIGNEKLIRLVKITNYSSVASNGTVATVKIQRVDSGGNWVDVVTASLDLTPDATTVITLPATIASRSWRVLAFANNLASTYGWVVREIEMMEALETHYVFTERNPITNTVSLGITKQKPRTLDSNGGLTFQYIPGYYTADLCEGGTVITGGDYSTAYPKENAFDNNPDTTWVCSQSVGNMVNNAYIGYVFNQPKHIRRITILNGIGGGGDGFKSMKAQYYLNGAWVDVANYELVGGKNTIDLPATTLSNQWRLLATGNRVDGASTGNAEIREIEMMEYVEPQIIISDDTKYTDNVCVGGVAISNGDYTGYPKENAFNGNNNTAWYSSQTSAGISGNASIGYDFGVARIIRKMQVVQGDIAGLHGIISVKIQNSSNGTTWNDVMTATLGSGLNNIDIPVNAGARFWRILANANISGTGNAWFIHEITMHEIATNLDYYDPISGVTKHFDGTSWTDKQRIYVGEAQVNSAGKIVKVTNYPIGLGNLRVKDAERKDEPVALGQFEFWGDALSGGRRNPDGSIEQWGVTSSIAHNTTKIIMFPKVFPNACTAFSGVILGDIGATATSLQLINKTPISANVKHVADSNATAVYLWTAIGY